MSLVDLARKISMAMTWLGGLTLCVTVTHYIVFGASTTWLDIATMTATIAVIAGVTLNIWIDHVRHNRGLIGLAQAITYLWLLILLIILMLKQVGP